MSIRWRPRRLAALSILLATFLTLAGYWLAIRGEFPLRPGGPALNPPVVEEPSNAFRVALTPETSIIFRTHYEQCGDEETRTIKAGEEHAGLDHQGLLDRYPGWEITYFGHDRVELLKREPGLCPEMARWRFIGIKEGRVAVFYGLPRPDAPVVEVTEIEARWLPEADRRRLEEGIPVEASKPEEIWRILEGLME